jgi:MFS family permease
MSALKKTARPGTIFIGLSSFQILAMFRRGIFYTFLGVYLRSYLGLSVTETSLFETIPMLLNIIFQTFVWGRLADRLQKRRSLIIAGELMASVGHLAMWFFHSINPDPRASGWVIIWSLTIIEIFWSMSNIGWSALISDVYTPAERNAVQGKLASLGGAGRMLGALIGGFLYDRMGKAFPGWGYREGGIFFVSAFAMLVSVIPILFMPEGGVAYRGAGEEGADASAGGRGGSAGDLRVFAVFLLAMLFINCGINSLASFKAQFLDLEDGFAASARTISLVMNVESLTLIVIGFFLGALGRRMGIPRLLVLGALSGVLSLLAYATAPGIGLIYVASILKGAADGCIASASYAFASILIPPEKRGRYFSAYNATYSLSWGTSATLITGPLIDGLLRAGRSPVFAYRMGVLSAVLIAVLGTGILSALLLSMKRSAARKA